MTLHNIRIQDRPPVSQLTDAERIWLYDQDAHIGQPIPSVTINLATARYLLQACQVMGPYIGTQTAHIEAQNHLARAINLTTDTCGPIPRPDAARHPE